MQATDIIIDAAGGPALAIGSEAQRAIGARALLGGRNGYGGGAPVRALVSIRSSSRAGGAIDAWVHPRATSASLAVANLVMRALAATPARTRGIQFGGHEAIAPERIGAGAAACLLEVDAATHAPSIGSAIARGLVSYVGALDRLERRIRSRFGDPEPMSCTGWEGDCQSMSKVIADRFFYNHLRRDQSIRAERINCSSTTSATVIYQNGEQVEVSWSPSTQRANATKFQNPPPDRGIITHWCDYSYSCTQDGTLHLTNDDCWG